MAASSIASFVATVWCDSFTSGEVEHSCVHGPPPHRIKVCIVKKSNRSLFPTLKRRADADQRRCRERARA
jgi:hypothetical protein